MSLFYGGDNYLIHQQVMIKQLQHMYGGSVVVLKYTFAMMAVFHERRTSLDSERK